jgi:hypothetical protein
VKAPKFSGNTHSTQMYRSSTLSICSSELANVFTSMYTAKGALCEPPRGADLLGEGKDSSSDPWPGLQTLLECRAPS